MMTNLFSPFDPCTGLLSLNWMSSLTIMLLLNFNMWTLKNNKEMILSKIYMKMNIEMSLILKTKGSSMFFMSMFFLILMNNMLGLLPYVFTASSHLLFSLSLALPSWLTFMLYGWMFKTNNMYMHLIPMGTPYILMPFMVLIETISNLIRPMSLAVRLSANMIAGHLLMTLLSMNLSVFMMMIMMISFIMLMIFELAVSMIQSYVFTILSSLYSSEI